MTRCKHDLDERLCAWCSPKVRAAATELDRLSRTAMATEGYNDLKKEDREEPVTGHPLEGLDPTR